MHDHWLEYYRDFSSPSKNQGLALLHLASSHSIIMINEKQHSYLDLVVANDK